MSWINRITMAAALGSACFLAGLPASAQGGQPDFARPGFYVGAGVQGAEFTDLDLGGGVDIDTGVGFDVFAGYRAHPHIAAELEFEMLPEVDLTASGFGKFAEVQTWALTANAKAYALTGRFQPFVLVGLGMLYGKLEDSVGLGLKESDQGFAARFGGGLDVYLTELISVFARTTYVLPTGDVSDVDYVSFGGGLQLRF